MASLPHPLNVDQAASHKADDIEAQPQGPATTRKKFTFLSFFSSSLLHDTLAGLACLILALGLEAASPRSSYVLKETLYWHGYPRLPNSVPSWTVPVYALLGPLALFLCYRFTSRRPWREVLRLAAGLILAFFLAAAVVNCLKLPVGRLRPNFVRVCWPNGTIVLSSEDQWGGYAVCEPSVTRAEENEVRKSWPSGHSALSASGLGFTSFFLLGQLRPFTHFHCKGRLWRFTIAILPACGAVAVGVTRVLDYWHFVSDVLTGLAIGFLAAFFVYRTLYPPLTHPRCNMPWSALSKMAGKGKGSSEFHSFREMED